MKDQESVSAIEPAVGNLSHLKLFTFFVTSENGIRKQDQYDLEREAEGVFAIVLTNILMMRRNQSNDLAHSYKLQQRLMHDFVGLDKIDDFTIEAIMNF